MAPLGQEGSPERPHPLVGVRGVVTTTIPAGGLGEVRVPLRSGGTSTYGAYSTVRAVPVPSGTGVVVVEVFLPRTLVVQPDA
ncbi:MAG TPA: hypothetical protein VE781_07770 [Kineosporiaceae bacterium]|jgi:hypothetical protein|nr:hypothetical protein [Kineosporiaceae bacterium]